ncbi:hypothetical protein E2C01_095686 [Portunus trituberculatus]|uniref:Uncharacterized protein n=1 Tax=Portunus trituberculatus TaxID=210409 RepID=A0A5B7K012_PORTR|nr:hypothetical protein [Portunus trituberculatus]
MAPPGKRIS